MSADAPWWWLTDDECIALGIGVGARRTTDGVVFGREGAGPRIEVVSRDVGGPVKLGSAAMRLWGAPLDDRGVALLAAAARTLHARRGRGFDPDRAPVPRVCDAYDVPARVHSRLIDVPSLCDRACVFCGVSRTPVASRAMHGRDADVDAAVDSLESGTDVLFTGNDAMNAPRLLEWIGRASARGATVRVISPWTAARDAPRARAFAQAGLAEISTGLFGATDGDHDAITGRAGSFDAVRAVAPAFRAAGIRVSFVTPLIRPVLARLAAIVHAAADLTDVPLTFLVYAPDGEVGSHFDALVPTHRELRAALLSVEPTTASFEAAPTCVLPLSRRSRDRVALDRSDVEARAVHPSVPCGACAMRVSCPGVAATVLRAVGVDGLEALDVDLR